MSGLPSITLEGTLTADPELRFTPKGFALAKYRVACNKRTLDKATGEWRESDPCYLSGTAWRGMAEHLVESCSKGDRVIVIGYLGQREWEKDGQKHTAYDIDTISIGPSLAFVTTEARAATRSTTGDTTDDPWATK